MTSENTPLSSEADAKADASFGRTFWRSKRSVSRTLPELAPGSVDDPTFRLLADNLPTLCWVANGDGYIVWYNRGWHDYCGTIPEQMEGWGWTAVHDPELLPRVMERWKAAIAVGEPWEMIFPLRGADGVFRPFLTRIVPVRDSTGAVKRWCGVNTKITDQVAAEQALKAERDRVRGVFENMAEGFVLLDRDFRVLDINAEGMRLEERSREEILGRTHWEAWPGSEESELGRLYKQAMAERAPVALEHCYVWADGHAAWLDMRAYPTADGLALFYRDVTDRKEAEEAARRAGEAARALAAEREAVLGQLAEGVIVADPQGRIVFVNDAAEKLHGVKLLGVEPDDYAESYHLLTEDGEPYPSHELPLARAVLDGETVEDARWRIRRPDGTEILAIGSARPIISGGAQPLGAVLTVRDDTERSRAEARLRTSETALRELNETLERRVTEAVAERDRIWAVSQDLLGVANFDGFFTSVNPAWEAVLGWTAQEVRATPFMELVHPDDQAATAAEVARLGEGARTLRFENRYRTKAGDYRWLSWTAVPEAGSMYTVARDISDEKARESELAEVQEALRQAQKMEAVGQLTGGIAHDFNNLLTGVIGSLDMMQRRIAKGETDRIERYATAAITSANRAAALTHRLLAFARRQPLDPKPVSANRLVTGMEELLRRTIGEAIQLEIVTAGGLWQTLCDPHQLESAILNLALNARDAMPDGGRLTIETCNAHLDSAYAAKTRDVRPGQYVCICVTDTGSGMPADTIAKAFEPFFTTKPIGQGTGLGLSMIYGFARQSEGYAKIYSEVGQGTTVKLYLPRYYGEVEDSVDAEGELTDEHRAEHGEVVLVVEDETAVRDLVVDVLQELGYRAAEAADGPSGLKLLQSDMRVDLLVTDIGLPGLNGRQLAEQARERRPELKVLFMTGYAENATLANGFLEPGMQMITKPFAVEALSTRLRDMIEAAEA